MEEIKMDRIEDAIADFKEGKFVIVVDDEDRENEGDLIIAAEKITPEKVNFMLKHARGVLCAPITVSRCKELDLPHQVLPPTVLLLFRRWPILLLHRLLSDVPDILIRCMHRKKEYFVVPDIQKLPSIWHALPDFTLQVL